MLERNQYMLSNSSLVIVLYNGLGGGTKSTIDKAKKQGKVVIIINLKRTAQGVAKANQVKYKETEYYVRYMDDMILVHHDKEYLKYCREQIEKVANNKLNLKLNSKTQVAQLKNGIDF